MGGSQIVKHLCYNSDEAIPSLKTRGCLASTGEVGFEMHAERCRTR